MEEVKKNYKQLIKVWHPDRFPNDTSVQRMCVEKMKLLNEAFKTLESLIKLDAAVAEGRYQPRYEEPQEQLAVSLEPVEQMGKWGYVDSQGHLRISAIYDTAAEFSEGLAAVKMDGKWGYIQSNGDWFILPRFEEAYPFKHGRAFAKAGGRQMMVMRNGEVRPA